MYLFSAPCRAFSHFFSFTGKMTSEIIAGGRRPLPTARRGGRSVALPPLTAPTTWRSVRFGRDSSAPWGVVSFVCCCLYWIGFFVIVVSIAWAGCLCRWRAVVFVLFLCPCAPCACSCGAINRLYFLLPLRLLFCRQF